jgi:hypothetical protein
MVATILEWYRGIYEELMAVPVICGIKSRKEKFAGADDTWTVEARARLLACTSGFWTAPQILRGSSCECRDPASCTCAMERLTWAGMHSLGCGSAGHACCCTGHALHPVLPDFAAAQSA